MRKFLSGLLIFSIITVPGLAQTPAIEGVCNRFMDQAPSNEVSMLVEEFQISSDEFDSRGEEYWERYRTDPTPEQLAEARKQTDQGWGIPVPDNISVIEVNAGGVPAEWVRAPGVNPDRRILYLHGGGWRTGSPTASREFTSRLSRSCDCSVLAIDYRLAPEHPFPAGVQDGLTALTWMRINGPVPTSTASAIFVVGASAGGNLALSLLLMARDAGTLPDAAVTFSAVTDLAAEGESFITRAELDPVLSLDPRMARQAHQSYLGEADLKNPVASPLYADLSGLPPLLMQVGDLEIYLDDTTRFAEKAMAAGVDVICEVEPGAPHVYQVLGPELPETKAAMSRVSAFLRKY
jgi:acetyl esterase/lipase